MSIEDYLSTQLKESEELLAVRRRHPMLLFPSAGLGGCLVLLDFFFLTWLFQHGPWGTLGFFGGLVIAGFIIGRGAYLWRQNVFAVTNQRVIDIDQRGVFERHVSEASLEKIQDVRYSVKGLWATMFAFGTVIVQTAGSTSAIEADGIHRPVELQRLITDTQRTTASRPIRDTTNILDVRRLQHHD